jgi:alpha-tubulin suppressor-like RCC1 family protein
MPPFRRTLSDTRRLRAGAVALALVAGAACSDPTRPDSGDSGGDPVTAGLSEEARRQLDTLRSRVEPFADFELARAEGWRTRATSCLETPAGGLGYHYANRSLIEDDLLRAEEPEALLYEPREDGSLRLVGVAFVVPFMFADQPPRIFDQELIAQEVAGVWALHVWIGPENPDGLFAPAHPGVSCAYAADDEDAVPELVEGALTLGAHTCALAATGQVYCWGPNRFGELGDGTTTDRLVPVPVSTDRRFARVEAGRTHTCALDLTGTAFCWGNNTSGQLGDGTTESRSVPTLVTGSHVFTRLWLGASFTCGRAADGATYCWGENDYGQLGDGTTTTRTVPTATLEGHAFVELALGTRHACGLEEGGNAYCWGYNEHGELGDGTTEDRLQPSVVAGDVDFAAIGAGEFHTCGLATGGDAYCWGYNEFPRLGDGTTEQRLEPSRVAGERAFAVLAVGEWHTCGLDVGGGAWCWGHNDFGELGIGNSADQASPAEVGAGATFTSIHAGDFHTCGMEAEGDAWCWGLNYSGQLGDGTTEDRALPTPVSGWGGTVVTVAEAPAPVRPLLPRPVGPMASPGPKR